MKTDDIVNNNNQSCMEKQSYLYRSFLLANWTRAADPTSLRNVSIYNLRKKDNKLLNQPQKKWIQTNSLAAEIQEQYSSH